MTKNEQRWVYIMDFFYKYWGCHQIASRSFFFRKYQLPLCARCTGLLCGYILGVIAVMFSYNNLTIVNSILLIFPTAVDGTIQFYTNYESNNAIRFFTGILAGIGGIFVLSHIVKNIFL